MGQGGVKVPHGIKVANQLRTGQASWLIWMDPEGSVKVDEEGGRTQREKDSTHRDRLWRWGKGPQAEEQGGPWKMDEARKQVPQGWPHILRFSGSVQSRTLAAFE